MQLSHQFRGVVCTIVVCFCVAQSCCTALPTKSGSLRPELEYLQHGRQSCLSNNRCCNGHLSTWRLSECFQRRTAAERVQQLDRTFDTRRIGLDSGGNYAVPLYRTHGLTYDMLSHAPHHDSRLHALDPFTLGMLIYLIILSTHVSWLTVFRMCLGSSRHSASLISTSRGQIGPVGQDTERARSKHLEFLRHRGDCRCALYRKCARHPSRRAFSALFETQDREP
jgi:hypothetical protein